MVTKNFLSVLLGFTSHLFVFGTIALAQIDTITLFGAAESGYASKALGPVCNIIDFSNSFLPCNPANIANEQDISITGNIFAGNNSIALSTAEKIVDGEVDEALVNKILEKYQVMKFQFDSMLSVRATNYGISYEPYRVGFFSFVTNPSYPMIDLYAFRESTIRGQIGTYLGEDFSLGLQIRGVNRKFVLGSFELFEAISEPGRYTMTAHDLNSIYLEPGLTYTTESSWKFRSALLLSNVGYVSERYTGMTTNPVIDIGAAISPPLAGDNRWDIAINYRYFSDIYDANSAFSLATAYWWHIYNFTTILNPKHLGFGILIDNQPLQFGLLLYQEEVVYKMMQSVYFNLGFNF